MAIGEILGGLGTSLFGKAVDFGFGAASNAMYEQQVRELRRTAYQDMMHSMKAAGLNPVLAAGASPGGASAAQIATGMTDAAGAIANVSTAKAAQEQAQTTKETRLEQVNKLKWEQDRLMEEVANRHRTNENIEADTKYKQALEMKALKEAGLLDVTARDVGARADATEYENKKREQDAEIYEGIEGAILRRIEAYTGAVLGGRKALGK